MLPELPNLNKITAEYCKIRNLKEIVAKFPSLNIGKFKHNQLSLYEDIEEIKDFEYLAELDIRENPLSTQPAIRERVICDVPDLEVFNEIELLEPGHRFRVENDKIREELAKAEDVANSEKHYEDIVDDTFGEIRDENGEKYDQRKLDERFEEAERNFLKNEADLLKVDLNISSKLVPLTRDENRLEDLENFTNEDLIKESKDFKKKVKDDYEKIRKDFRNIMNQLRFSELETFDKLASLEANVNLGKDPYLAMQDEIRKIDEEARKNKVKYGFVTSRSNKEDSDDEDMRDLSTGKENESMVHLDSKPYSDLSISSSAKKAPRRSSLTKKSSVKGKALPFRSSAGFGNRSDKTDLTAQIKTKKKPIRAESARRKNLPPSSMNKERLNELKEIKMTQEKDKIMDEFHRIVSKTTTSFKEPKFPNSTRKRVLEPIKSMSKDTISRADSESGISTAVKNITKFTKPNMLAAQNDAIREMLKSKSTTE